MCAASGVFCFLSLPLFMCKFSDNIRCSVLIFALWFARVTLLSGDCRFQVLLRSIFISLEISCKIIDTWEPGRTVVSWCDINQVMLIQNQRLTGSVCMLRTTGNFESYNFVSYFAYHCSFESDPTCMTEDTADGVWRMALFSCGRPQPFGGQNLTIVAATWSTVICNHVMVILVLLIV